MLLAKRKDYTIITKVCNICGAEYRDYATSTSKTCPECLNKEHSKTCIQCGKLDVWRPGRGHLKAFLQSEFCSVPCRINFEDKRPQILSGIFNNLIINPQEEKYRQKPCIDQDSLDEVIAENCGLFRLYQLYSFLEPYYKEDDNGKSFSSLLPSTQLYLNEILRRIRNLEELLRVTHDKKIKGNYTTLKSPTKGNWNSGPTEEDLLAIELINI